MSEHGSGTSIVERAVSDEEGSPVGGTSDEGCHRVVQETSKKEGGKNTTGSVLVLVVVV